MGIVSIRAKRAAAQTVTLTGFTLRAWARSASVLSAVVILLLGAGWGKLTIAEAASNTISVVPPVNVAVGAQALLPLSGAGFNVETNYKPYAIPGENEETSDDPCQKGRNHYVPGSPFALSYANPGQQPVQSSDWWSSMGFQLEGWVSARGGIENCVNTGNPLANTASFTSEPFNFQFIDFNQNSGNKGIFGTFPAEAGLALWNQNNFQVATNTQVFQTPPPAPTPTPVGAPTPTPTPVGAPTPSAMPTVMPIGYNSNFDLVGYGNVGPSHQARVTIGLEGVHPLREDEFPNTDANDNPVFQGPKAPPWTNIQVQSYSDWGVQASFHDKNNTNQLNFFANNGSPFVWFQRTKGTAAFNVWVGGVPTGAVQGTYKQVKNENGVLIVSVTTIYVPNYNNRMPNNNISATSYYSIWANKGAWTQKATANSNSVAMYQDADASAVVVTALPHNFSTDTEAVTAWNFMRPYACRETTNTQLILPTPPQNVTVNGSPVTLGYSPVNATITGELSIDNGIMPGFEASCKTGDSLQMIFPHHRKVLVASQRKQIVTSTPGPLIWNTLVGPAMAYVGKTMYLQNQTRGVMPMLPSVAIDDPKITNPNDSSQTAAQDIYNTLKAWYFVEEPTKPSCKPSPSGCDPPTGASHLNSFARNPSTYMTTGDNTYITGTTTLRELMVVADQLAQTSNTSIKGVLDKQLGQTEDQAAAEIRNFTLRTLEEFVGQWGDVYTANLLMYNPDYDTMYGYPTGYGDVGHLADHHYHYGYFLRAAAAIGRYDPAWLKAHMTIFTNLLNDVACFKCNVSGSFTYPPLRNFNPYVGHSWADGAAYGGNNQESTSEAINFEVGLIELGELSKNDQWRDLGLYLYEQEINAVQQYWYNQDADLTDQLSKPAVCPTGAAYTSVKSDPPVCYNGNWPREFVTYKRATDSSVRHHTLGTQLFNFLLSRTTFFDASPFAAYTIEAVPAGPSGLYLSRNLPWLQATWEQFMSDNDFYQSQTKIMPIKESVYGNVAATMQGILPASGNGIEGTGLAAALARINPVHAYYTAAMNTEAKYMAYTISALGSLNGSYTATTPSGGAFTSSTSTSFVAYNPTGSPISVTFNGSPSAGPFTIPPNTEQTYKGGTLVSSFKPGAATGVPPSRLYFRNNLTLTSTPGTAMPPASGSYPVPTDTSLIKGTFVTIPPRGDGMNVQFPAPTDLKKIVTFVGSFSGNILDPGSCREIYKNQPNVCDPTTGLQSVDRFAIYTDQCLSMPTGGPGWQRCNTIAAGNTYNMVVSYYFDTTKCKPGADGVGIVPASSPVTNCNADRIEYYTMQAGPSVNSWSGTQDEANEYYFSGIDLSVPEKPGAPDITSGFNGSFGLNLQDIDGNSAGVSPASCGGNPDDGSPKPPYYDPLHNGTNANKAPGPCFQGTNVFRTTVGARGLFVPTVKNGGLVLQFWGGAVTDSSKNAPIPLSVEVDPITNRASWFQPPYVSAVRPTSTPAPTRTPTRTPTAKPATPTPTRTPTGTPSRTPTRTPSRTPTRTPSRTPTRTPTRTPIATRTATPRPTPTSAPAKALALWVPNLGSDSISEYTGASLSASGTPAADAVIQSSGGYFSSLKTPDAVTFDSLNNLWSTNCHGGPDSQGSVTEFTLAQLQSLQTDNKPTPITVVFNNPALGSLDCPTGSTFDHSGNLWVANNGSSNGGPAHLAGFGSAQLSGYTNVQPQTSIYGGGLSDPLGMTFDRGHNLWVADLRAGNNGALFQYTADQLSTGGIQVPNVIVSSASLRQPETVVVDKSGNLWTVNCGNATLQMFAAGDLIGSGTIRPVPQVTIGARTNSSSVGLDCKEGLALDSSGGLWVANYYSENFGSLVRFAPEQIHKSGNPAPEILINSNSAGSNMSRPFLIGFGPAIE